jgi:hypothetical protein
MEDLYARLPTDSADLSPQWTVLGSKQEISDMLALAVEWRASAGPFRFGDRLWMDPGGVLHSSRWGGFDLQPLASGVGLRVTPPSGMSFSVLISVLCTGREWILLIAHSKGVEVFTGAKRCDA